MKLIIFSLSMAAIALSLSACKQSGKNSEIQRYGMLSQRVELGPKKCQLARSKANDVYVPVYSEPNDDKKMNVGVGRGSDSNPIKIRVNEVAGETFVKVRIEGPSSLGNDKDYYTKKNTVKVECLEDGGLNDSIKPYAEKMSEYNITDKLKRSLGYEEKVGYKLGIYICSGELKSKQNEPPFATFKLFGRYGNPSIPELDGKPTSAHLEINYTGSNNPEVQPLYFANYNGVNSWIYERNGSVLRIKIGREDNRTKAKLIKVNSKIFSPNFLVPYTTSQACQFYPQEKAEFLEYLPTVGSETLVCGGENDEFYYQVEATHNKTLGNVVINKDPAPIITVFGGANKDVIQERKALSTVGRTWLTQKTFLLKPAFPEVKFSIRSKADGSGTVEGNVKVTHAVSIGSGKYGGTIKDIELTCPAERRKVQ